MKNTNSKTLVLFLFLITLGIQGFSQTPEVIKGSPYKTSIKDGWGDISPLGCEGIDTYYLLLPLSEVYNGAYIGSKDTFVGRVNKDMELEKVEKLSLEYDGKALNLEFAIELGNISYIFSSFQNNNLKKSFLFAQKLDRKTMVAGTPIPVAEIDYSGENKYKTSSFSYKLSPDSSRVLFTHNLLDNDGSLLSFGYTVTDRTLKMVDQVLNIELAGDGIYSFQDFYLNNTGQVYLLTKFFNEKKDYRKNVQLKKQGALSSTRSHEVETNYDFKVLKFSKSSSRPQSLTLDLKEAFITSLHLRPKNDGGLMCIGFYSDNGDAIPDGVFTQDVNKLFTVISTDKQSLAGQFDQPSKYVNETYKGNGIFGKKDDVTNYRFVLKDIIQKKSGGYVLAAERNTTLTKTQNSGGHISTFNVYHTDDIVLADVSSTGKINWTKQVEKAQETTGFSTLYASFSLQEHNENILLFFTDLASANFKLFGKVVKTESVMVRVDPNGNQTKEVLFNAAEDAITMKAANTYKTPDGAYILYGHNGQFTVGFCKAEL